MSDRNGARQELPAAADAIVAESVPLTSVFAAAGRRLYLVGGIVRDLFLDAVPTPEHSAHDVDLDFTTDARPEEVRRLIGPVVDNVWTQGERFGTIAAHLDGRLVEITTHRAEAYDPASRRPDVVFADDVEVDLSRRDFTVNAMAVELTTGSPRLIDPFGGLADLERRRLATPLSPAVSFSDDPLRMLRAARFAARLGLVPDDDVVAAMRSMAGRLEVVSAERVRDELDKLLTTDDPTAGLRLLLETGVADRALPELAESDVGAIVAAPPDALLRFSVALVPAGAVRGRRRAKALRRSRAEVTATEQLVGALARLLDGNATWSEGEVRRLALAAAGHLDALPSLVRAVGRAGRGEQVAGLLEDLGHCEDLSDLRPALDGAAVMSLLGLAPGRDVGDALTLLRTVRLDEGPISAADAEERLRRWWAHRRRE